MGLGVTRAGAWWVGACGRAPAPKQRVSSVALRPETARGSACSRAVPEPGHPRTTLRVASRLTYMTASFPVFVQFLGLESEE